MWLAQFVCAPQFFKTPSGLCGHTVLDVREHVHFNVEISTLNASLCLKAERSQIEVLRIPTQATLAITLLQSKIQVH
jgi:hypothetical protein